MTADKTFLEITNRDIYDAIQLNNSTVSNIEQHLVKLNGSVKSHTISLKDQRKLIYGAYGTILTVSVAFVGFLIVVM